ncbi:MAG: UvrABC system protein B [Microgenomates group bacterium GW2011_GWF2_47_9]|nr:MAG: UvrABC system protein B [Microgenomates group bacterium GW2011_GWF2_47_9]
MQFKLKSAFKPTGDQPQAIEKLTSRLGNQLKDQVLLGVTGSGKTFTMANVIENTQLPTLIITHNKTLAGQLYQEMRDFFPENAVSYFVSYYDYYQPEAYIPTSDTYIEKEAQINQMIDKLRLQSTTNIMTRRDVIVVASVSCIYNIGDPREYGKFELPIYKGLLTDWKSLASRLIEMQYDRSEFEFVRGSFRIRGNNLDLYPAYQDVAYRIAFLENRVIDITPIDPVSGARLVDEKIDAGGIVIYPAKHYMLRQERFQEVEAEIRQDLAKEHQALKAKGKLLEAQRLLERTNYDLEILSELGYVNGIENYSRYFDSRQIGDRPYALQDYFNHAYQNNWLTIIDESHMTIPQLRGMYNGDNSRKRTLVDFGFRLKAALDNRPLKFTEFLPLSPRLIYVSATPSDWELQLAKKDLIESGILPSGLNDSDYTVEQLVRPTGIVDPIIEVRPADTQIQDIIKEVVTRAKAGERSLITTLTKKTAEDLTQFLTEKGIRANYLHSDIKTLERSDILDNLRQNKFDCLIGVNLLREGLDLPEVTLVAILDADKEGFLRSRVSLIQTMGRAARNIRGSAILYADHITDSMKSAIDEITRRRDYQLEYNSTHKVTPKNIIKPVRIKIVEESDQDPASLFIAKERTAKQVQQIDTTSLTAYDREKLVKKLTRNMKRYATDLNFEAAIAIRDKLRELKGK